MSGNSALSDKNVFPVLKLTLDICAPSHLLEALGKCPNSEKQAEVKMLEAELPGSFSDSCQCLPNGEANESKKEIAKRSAKKPADEKVSFEARPETGGDCTKMGGGSASCFPGAAEVVNKTCRKSEKNRKELRQGGKESQTEKAVAQGSEKGKHTGKERNELRGSSKSQHEADEKKTKASSAHEAKDKSQDNERTELGKKSVCDQRESAEDKKSASSSADKAVPDKRYHVAEKNGNKGHRKKKACPRDKTERGFEKKGTPHFQKAVSPAVQKNQIAAGAIIEGKVFQKIINNISNFYSVKKSTPRESSRTSQKNLVAGHVGVDGIVVQKIVNGRRKPRRH